MYEKTSLGTYGQATTVSILENELFTLRDISKLNFRITFITAVHLNVMSEMQNHHELYCCDKIIQ